MTFEELKKKIVLKEGETSPEHDHLLSHVKKLFQISRDTMCQRYHDWDYYDDVFRSKRVLDREDRASVKKSEPAKMIVPLTFSQVMTFVSFCVMNITQNKRFFELEFEGNKPPELKEIMELILERDCRRNRWNSFLVQFFLDIGRFGVGAAEVCYMEEYRNIRVEAQNVVQGTFGTQRTEATSQYQQIPTFIGNRVYPLSPYRIFPDTRLPLTRFQEGEFCGSEDMFSLSSLQSDSNLFNLDQIPKMTETEYQARRRNTRIDQMDFIPAARMNSDGSLVDQGEGKLRSGSCVVSKMVFELTPKNFKMNGENVLGTEPFPLRYIVWIANDKTIVRFDEAYYLHGQYPYILSQYLPDQHQVMNEGLSSTLDQLTTLITWKLNAHLTSQKQSVDSKYIIDPAGVDLKTLDSRSPYIFLKKNMGSAGIDKYIKQFVTTDVTDGVMSDISALNELLEKITGISGQMQGEYSQGRRSATQDRVVAQGASARAKTTLSSIWDTSFEPLGRQFIANNRQEMDVQTFVRIVGQGPFGVMQNITVQQMFQAFKADPVAIATSEDFFVFDGTIPSEKAFLAQSLQEIVMEIFQNPEIAQILGYGPEQLRYLFDEIYELRGVTPPMLPPSQAPVQPQQDQGDKPKPPSESINYSLKDFVGEERTQALALIGIRADNVEHDKQRKEELAAKKKPVAAAA